MGRLRLSSPGEWSRLPIKGLAEKDRPEFKIGTVPSGKRKELLYQHFGRHQKIRTRRVKEDGESYTVSERNLDNEQTAAFAVAVALRPEGLAGPGARGFDRGPRGRLQGGGGTRRRRG